MQEDMRNLPWTSKFDLIIPKQYSFGYRVPAGHTFAGAWVGSLELAKPAAGEWRFETAPPERAGYLMVAAHDTDLSARLKIDRLVVTPGSTRKLAVFVTVTGTLGDGSTFERALISGFALVPKGTREPWTGR